jgi:hypothetical protein
VDISDPANPVHKGSITIGSGGAFSIFTSVLPRKKQSFYCMKYRRIQVSNIM